MIDCTDQSLEDASSNRIPTCADSFERPEGPQHTKLQDRVTHGCFGLYKSSLAGCMQANGLAADACSGLKDSFFGVESKQKLMAGGSALLLFYKKVGVSGHLEIGSSPHHTSPYLTSPHRTAPQYGVAAHAAVAARMVPCSAMPFLHAPADAALPRYRPRMCRARTPGRTRMPMAHRSSLCRHGPPIICACPLLPLLPCPTIRAT